MIPYNKKNSSVVKMLRKNMTAEERHLWYDFLKHLPTSVYRQRSIGNYIVDFYIASKKIVIEIDGSQHTRLLNKEMDMCRDAFFVSLGITVLRYSNEDIHQRFFAVSEDILKHIGLSFEDLKL